MLGPVEGPERAAPGEPPPPKQPRRLAWSTAIFASATGLSRILGLVREIVARNYFGVQGPINAFEIAFLIPNTVRALVADAALSSAFVPVFSELLEKVKRDVTAMLARVRIRSEEEVQQLEAEDRARMEAQANRMQFQHADSGGFGVDEEAAEAQAMAMMGQGVLSPARVASGPKVGRNDPCPCGSGRKFKQCHGQLT